MCLQLCIPETAQWVSCCALESLKCSAHHFSQSAWRFIFDREDTINALYSDDTGITFALPLPCSNKPKIHRTVITTLSGQRDATLRVFDASTGHLISEQSLHPPLEGTASQPLHFGRSVAYVADKPNDLLVLIKGYQLSHIDGSNGELKWTWAAPDQGYACILACVECFLTRLLAPSLHTQKYSPPLTQSTSSA